MTTKGTSKTGGISRRTFLKSTAGTAALIGSVQSQFPFGVHIAEAHGPEVKKAVLGYIALMDASPLVIAKEKGLFAKHGMPDVDVSKQASWGATRDNLVLGSENNGIDGAHILTPMPYLISDRQGDAEQRADADVHPGAAQSRCPGDLGLQRIQGPRRSPPMPRRSRLHSKRRKPPARR